MPAESFDDLTDVYEALVDWPKRLAHEAPFYRHWFDTAKVRNVTDTACGTGRHAAMFHSWGLEVEGADISPRMVGCARATFGEPAGLRWVVRGFDQPIGPPGTLDAAVCVGNSLALAPDVAAVQRVIAAMLAAIRPGGVVILQVLNLWRLPDGPCLWQKCKRTGLSQGEVLILKGVHRSGDRGYVELAVAAITDGSLLQNESVPFLGLEAHDLDATARAGGATAVTLLGGYQQQPYDRAKSVDLVLIAQK